MVGLNEEAPDFSLPSIGGEEVFLKDLFGSWAVLFFYSKDGTSG
jgi:peroxiredoxin